MSVMADRERASKATGAKLNPLAVAGVRGYGSCHEHDLDLEPLVVGLLTAAG